MDNVYRLIFPKIGHHAQMFPYVILFFFTHKRLIYFSALLYSFHEDSRKYSLVEISLDLPVKMPKLNLRWVAQKYRSFHLGSSLYLLIIRKYYENSKLI